MGKEMGLKGLEVTGFKDVAKEMRERINKGKCPSCGNPVNMNDFRDELSLKDFQITGLCQRCQDEIYGSEE